MTEPEQKPGLLGSLVQLIGNAGDFARDQLDSIRGEFELEKRRLLDVLVWASLAMLALALGLLTLSILVAALFWDSYRFVALATLAVIYLGFGTWLWRLALRRLRNDSKAQTLASTLWVAWIAGNALRRQFLRKKAHKVAKEFAPDQTRGPD